MSKVTKIVANRMRFMMIYVQILLSLAFALIFNANSYGQAKPNFVIVIDAGHGGHDIGARGVVQNEKDIVLDVALQFGGMIEKNHKDVKVIYTRKTDVFLKLWERAQIANKNHANLFVSIHCNSAENRRAYGTETFVMGLQRMSENAEVSKRENSVILLEEDQERYQKFDPNDEEAVIMFEIMHSAYLSQSIEFAKFVEDEFVAGGRSSRGVKQDIFHVLRENASPAVLIELGFISNQDEGAFLATNKGKQKMAEAIYSAFVKYKNEYNQKNNNGESTVVEAPKEVEKPVIGLTYKIQILVSKNKYSPSATQLKGLTNVEVVKVGDLYKYYYGNTNLPSERDELLRYVKRKGFNDAFVVELKENLRLEGKQNYKIEFLVANKRYRERDRKFGGLPNVLRVKIGKSHHYYYGFSKTYEEALKELKFVQSKGFKNANIVLFDGNNLLE